MADTNAQQDFAKLSEDLTVLRADVAKLAETLTVLAKTQGEAAADAVTSRVRQGKRKAEATAAGLYDEGVAAYEDVKERAGALGGDVTAAIERIALGVGFLFGLLSRGR